MLSFAEKWKRIGEFKERERRRWMQNTPVEEKLALLKSLLSEKWPVHAAPDPVGPYSYDKRVEAARRARANRQRGGGPRRRRPLA
ncbi:MAG: hypothetical protein HYZ53_07275 [Planctomycetes bacterium]|nr:hypothetical protein [Planctomycetota bacterium]